MPRFEGICDYGDSAEENLRCMRIIISSAVNAGTTWNIHANKPRKTG